MNHSDDSTPFHSPESMAGRLETASPEAGVALSARNPAGRLVKFGFVLFVALATLIVTSMLCLQLLHSSKSVYGEMRGAPSLALLAGRPIYQGRHVEGPLFAVPYAPFFYLLYKPIGLWRRPESVLLAGSAMSFVFYSIPLWYLMLRFRRESRYRGPAAASMPLLFLAYTLVSAPLTYSSTQLCADGPALGFAGLAGCIFYFHHSSNRWLHPVLCSLMCVLAVGSKQTALPVLAAIPVLALLLGNRAFTFRYLIGTLVFCLSAVAVVMLFYRGASHIVFNSWTLPSHAEFLRIMVLVAMSVLHEESLPLLHTAAAIALVALAARWQVSWADFRRLAILPIISLAVLPSSFLAMTLIGADRNALSPPIYFGLLSVLVLVYDSTVNALPVARLWAAASLITAGLLVPLTMRGLRPPNLKQALNPGLSEVAFEYARRHPGEVYFPDHQLSVYLAEGQFYHSDWGVMVYVRGGIPLRREDVLAYVPPTARYVAYPFDPPGQFVLPYVAPHRRSHPIAELAEFDVFEMER